RASPEVHRPPGQPAFRKTPLYTLFRFVQFIRTRGIHMKARISLGVALLALCAFGTSAYAAQAGGAGGPPRGGGGGLVQMLVESNAFPDGGIVPPKHSMAGGNVQPDFKLSNVPANAQSIAIIMHDLDVAFGPASEDVLHWVVW